MKTFYTTLNSINSLFQQMEKLFGSLALAVLFVVMIVNAALRYLFKGGLDFSDELNGFLFVWFSFLSAAYTMSTRSHLNVTFVLELFPHRVQVILNILMNIIMIAAFLIFMPALWKLMNTLPISNVMRVPMGYVYIILPLSFLLMCWHLVFNTITDLIRLKENRKEAAQQ